MRIIKDKKIVNDDWQWVHEIDASAPLPDGNVILPIAYWLANRDKLLGSDSLKAVWIDGSIEPRVLLDDLDKFSIIALNFPLFKDGRCYSHARLLRERYGYKGELRAIGDILRDQLFFMQRCGIDSYEVRQDKDIEEALAAFEDFSVKYQTAADGALPVYKLR